MRYFFLAFLCSLSVATLAQPITNFPYFEDFENGQGGWSSGGSGTWAFGNPAKPTIQGAASGTRAWVTGGLTGQYNNNENSQVTSPVFDFSGLQQPVIQLSIWWDAEYTYDGAVLQASTNGGSSWVNIGSVGNPNNWFNYGSISGQPGGSSQGWSGTTGNNGSGGWVTAKHGLNNLIGASSVRFRVAFGSDFTVQDDGFAFDDILIFDRKANDVGILSIESPVQDCNFGGTYDVELRCRNFGFAPADSFSLAYQINNDPPVIEAFQGSVNSDQNFVYTFNQQAVLNQENNYRISTWVIWPKDEENSNDSVLDQGLKNVMPFGPISFEGFAGNELKNVLPGWNEATGNAANIGPSDWTECDSTQNHLFGFSTARVNIKGNGVNEWVLTPPFKVGQASRMFYSIAVTGHDDTLNATMGSDDEILVRLSSDCGATWTDLKTYNASSNLNKVLSQDFLILDSYINQEIIIGFQARSNGNDPEDYDFHIGLHESRFVWPNDVGISEFRLEDHPNLVMQAGTGDYFYYTIKNFGSNSVGNIPVIARIGNSTYQHVQYQNINQNMEEEIFGGGYWAYTNGPAWVPVNIYTMLTNDTINVNDTFSTYIQVLGVTGNSSFQLPAETKLYPNPSDGKFQIDFGSDRFFEQVEIFDLSGKILWSHVLQNNLDGISVDLSGMELVQGTYLVRLSGKATETRVLELLIK